MANRVHRCLLCGWCGSTPTDEDNPSEESIHEWAEHMCLAHPSEWALIQHEIEVGRN